MKSSKSLQRRQPLKRNAPLPPRRAPLKRTGKKGKAWAQARRKLKREFARAGVVRCQMCGADNYLSFAHRLKRRFITSAEELATCALLCVSCHQALEELPHAAMFALTTQIIEEAHAPNF